MEILRSQENIDGKYDDDVNNVNKQVEYLLILFNV